MKFTLCIGVTNIKCGQIQKYLFHFTVKVTETLTYEISLLCRPKYFSGHFFRCTNNKKTDNTIFILLVQIIALSLKTLPTNAIQWEIHEIIIYVTSY